MKNIMKSLLIALVLGLGFTNAYAGAGHSHTASKYLIKSKAVEEIRRLAKIKKIPASWRNSEVINMQEEGFLTGKEWVVSFKNSEVADKSKQIINIYLTTYGKVKGANFKK